MIRSKLMLSMGAAGALLETAIRKGLKKGNVGDPQDRDNSRSGERHGAEDQGGDVGRRLRERPRNEVAAGCPR
jgi:hypothetical protein